MNLPDILVQDPDGEIHVKGHRIGLQDLVFFYNQGHSAEGLLEVFPTLPLVTIHKFIVYYLEHRAEVDAFAADYEAEIERQRAATPRGPSISELRRRLAAKQASRT